MSLLVQYSSMNDSVLSRLTETETCQRCESLTAENKRLRQKLSAEYETQKSLQILKKIKAKAQDIELAASRNDIEIGDLAQTLAYALNTLLAIKSEEIVRGGKEILELVMQLHEQGLKQQQETKAQQGSRSEEDSLEIKPEKPQRQEKNGSHADQFQESPPTQKMERKKETGATEVKMQKPTQRQAQGSIFDELNRFGKKEEQLGNPYVQRDPTPNEEKRLKNVDEEQQKLSILNTSSWCEDITLPLSWEKRTFFDMSGKVITKKYNDIYKKICTESPLPRSGKHEIKFQMINNGTVAFGIVTSAFKNENMIDDRKCDAVKYLSFSNGKGMIKFCGDEIMSGQRVHLKKNQILDITFNADTLEVVFKNPNLMKPLEIKLNEKFRNKELYFFLEMKHCDTAVKMI